MDRNDPVRQERHRNVVDYRKFFFVVCFSKSKGQPEWTFINKLQIPQNNLCTLQTHT